MSPLGRWIPLHWRGLGGGQRDSADFFIFGKIQMKDNTPQAVEKCHQLIAWIIPQLDKFPRNRRFTLGDKIEKSLLDTLSLLVEITFTRKSKARLLEKVNIHVTVLRHLWRLAFELHTIAQKQYIYGGKLLVALGQQIGGWQKYASE